MGEVSGVGGGGGGGGDVGFRTVCVVSDESQ